MHYYTFHIKDYMMATRHLSLEEDGCYRRILDQYYDTEGNLPELEKLARIIGAGKEMVHAILTEFFKEIDGKFYNHRADMEIEAYHAKSEGGKKGAKSRWEKAKAKDSHSIAITNPQDTQCQVNANHEPLPINHEPRTNINTLSGKPDVVSLGEESQKPKKRSSVTKHRPTAEMLLAFLNEEAHRAYKPLDANLEFIAARLEEGATIPECRAVIIRKTREWRGTEMDKYLRPSTLFNREKFAQYQGELVV